MGYILCRVVSAENYKSKNETFFAGNMKYPAKYGTALGRLRNPGPLRRPHMALGNIPPGEYASQARTLTGPMGSIAVGN